MDLPSPSPTVIVKEMTDGAVLYCTRTEVYFGLNEVGLAIWDALASASATLDDLVDTLSERFPDVPRSTIREDAEDFLRDLKENGLITPPESAVPAH
jgi:hypothetical protein